MTRVLSLAYLTGTPLPPPEMIALAEKLGYGAVGLRAMAALPGGDFDPLIQDKAMRRETIARMKATGVGVFDVEIVRIAADFALERFHPFLELCGELAAKAILVAGDDPDEGRLTASYAAFCDAAAPYGLTADLEFMPWTKVPNARTALRIVQAAARPNGGILVDALHAARSATTLDDLTAIPRALLHYAQICDAPTPTPKTDDELMFTARHARLLPGDGGIDLAGIFACLPSDLPVSVEIPNDVAKARLGPERWSQQALDATKGVLGL
ncbi:MAG: sugar phosphate isomerase/epimerase [Bradyrhizobium sp.]|uniref:sugar phosphate isomerase/epimerase family protein n=1 Tax=Bradyrhizobium sp. TaxID=376 RepID=UPI001E1322DD|nr:sugar phosphate isomerase/epimerase [Bradyrhizobium sp.]MBV9565145.1 sugar phosphate isomerase/epimerase [Bradyrhizobium sp.]